MSLVFEPKTHSYTSVDPSDNTRWISVKTLISALKQPFDSTNIAKKSSTSKKSKWFGMTIDQIQGVWKKESDRACTLGNWYHDQREQDITNCETIVRYDKVLPVIRPMQDEHGLKVASSQKLMDGIYPEHMVYMRSAGICGQSDLVEVADGFVHITDYKTNKEIKGTYQIQILGHNGSTRSVISLPENIFDIIASKIGFMYSNPCSRLLFSKSITVLLLLVSILLSNLLIIRSISEEI